MGMKPRAYFEPDIVAYVEPILANALIAAKRNGYKIVQGHCRHCGEANTRAKTICLLCALMQYRGRDRGASMETAAAIVLGVKERYVLDLVSGFDNDGEGVTYRDAKRLGRKLWSKHGRANA